MLSGGIKCTTALILVALAGSACTGLTVSRSDTVRAADPQARRGGKLVIGIERPASIDPGIVSDDSGKLIASLLCEPLVSLDPQTGRIARGIVDSIAVGSRGSVFTLKLRAGVKFHNGQTVTAQDIVYSLSRVARHDFAGTLAGVLSPVAGYADINAPQLPTDTEDPARRTLTGVRAISRTALEIALSEPNGDFMRALTLPLAAPVPRGLPDNDRGFADRPVCAGPYQLSQPYRPDDQVIELRRFPGYYAGNVAFTLGGTGYPEVIEFRIAQDREAEMRDFQAGVLDAAHVPPAKLSEARQLGPQFLTTPIPAIEFVGVPGAEPSFQDPQLRAVLSRTIDRQRVVSEVYHGGRLAAGRFIPPALFPSTEAQECANEGEVTDAVLVALQATKLQFKVNEDFSNRAMAENLALQWREKLGLDVEVVGVAWDKYLEEMTGPTGVDTFFRQSWMPLYPSIDAVFFPLFHSSQIGNNNFARFNDRTFDRRLVRVARREVDDEVRRLKYLSLEEILCQEMPLIPVTFGQEEYLVRTERIGTASGTFFDSTTGQLLLREFFIR